MHKFTVRSFVVLFSTLIFTFASMASALADGDTLWSPEDEKPKTTQGSIAIDLSEDEMWFFKLSRFIFPDRGTWPAPLRSFYEAYYIEPLALEEVKLAGWVKLEAIPANLKNGLIAVEDKRFRQHFGIDPWSIARALTTNILSKEVAEGGSTLTQQLVKNRLLSHERTLSRKVAEMFLALVVEARYSKDQILEVYLNTVYLGDDIYGVKQGAQHYFQTELSKLSLNQCAVLAGLPNAPNALDPVTCPTACRQRRDLVLLKMKENGDITSDVYEKAIANEDLLH